MQKGSWLVFCLICSFSIHAHAEKKRDLNDARSQFKKGTIHFKNEEYAEAADAFRDAYKLRPNWKVLYNIAQSEAAAKRHGRALTAFERYLALGGDDVVETRREEVEKEIERLKKMVGYVAVEAPEGATIVIDGVEYGVAPIVGGIPVAGSVVHIVEVMMPSGEKPPFKKVSLVSGNNISVSFIEEKEASPEPPAAAPTEIVDKEDVGQSEPSESIIEAQVPEKRSLVSPLVLAGWISVGTGAGMLIAAGITGGLALKKNSIIEDNCPDGCYEPYHDAVDKRNMLAITTDTLLGVGGAVTAVGAGLLIVHFVKNKKERRNEQTVLLQPMVNHQVIGAFLDMRF